MDNDNGANSQGRRKKFLFVIKFYSIENSGATPTYNLRSRTKRLPKRKNIFH